MEQAFPYILAGKSFKEIIRTVKKVKKNKKEIIFCGGAHLIKCGLSLWIIELMKKGYLNCIALNGAGIIHDSEIALFGETSELVEESLPVGMFGVTKETNEFINKAVTENVAKGFGLGTAVAEKIFSLNPEFKNYSILYNAYKFKIPVCVFIAIGTDINCMHSSYHPKLFAEGSYRDFLLFTEKISNLSGGILFNVGSAVILPEVILKSLNLAKNLGANLKNITGVNFDFNWQYRSNQQVVRLEIFGGKSYAICGHHEILIPLLAGAILNSEN